jgi:hypothetical protein
VSRTQSAECRRLHLRESTAYDTSYLIYGNY